MKRDKKALDIYLNQLFEKRGYPCVAVCIRGPEGILYERGFGHRSIEKNLPVDGDTVFGIASMSKSMTALACCILETEGKMSLDDPVVKYFPTFRVPGTPKECITVRHLAMHTAGIPPMEPIEWSIAMNSVERDSEWLREMRRTSPNKMDKIEHLVDYISAGNYVPLGMPGEYMSYSNEGYAIMSYIVDMAAGIPLEQFLDERIFGPLEMTRSVLDEDCSRARELAAGNITSLYDRDENGNIIWDDNWSVLPPFRGCACVKSTARDITKYYKMLSDGGMYEGRQVVPAEAVDLLIGKAFPLTKKPYYCLGLSKSLIGGKMVCDHSGGLHGVSTKGGLVEGGYSVAVLCSESELGMEEFQWVCYNYILGLPLDEKHYWAMPSGEKFSMEEALVGEYVSNEGIPAHNKIFLEDGKLMVDMNGQSKNELLYCQGTVFAVMSNKDPEERVSTYEFYLRGGKTWAVKCDSRIYQRVDG